MTPADPLRTVEMLALLEEATTPLRHDVRNRIASIRNLSYFVRRKLGSEIAPDRDPRVNDFLSKIESEVQRTDEVIEAWSNRVYALRSPEPKRVKVADCIRLAIDCTRCSARVGVEFSAPTEPLEVEADLETLAFALRCLLENAAEAVGSGSVGIATEREGNQCWITVADRGPGIAEPVRCLERFESSKSGHLGLGLSMARRIVTRFGGDLVLRTPEAGAKVSLLLPLAGFRVAVNSDR